MRIASYNIRSGGKGGAFSQWQSIMSHASPDILLVQESYDPKKYIDPIFYEQNQNQFIWQPKPSNEQRIQWGSAIYVRTGKIKPIQPPEKYQGYVIGAEVEGFVWGQEELNLRILNFHAPTPYKASFNEILDWLVSSFDFEDGYLWVIGGDFNDAISLAVNLLRIELGMIPCWQNMNEYSFEILPTLRQRGKLYYCDGIFVPAVWYQWMYYPEMLILSDWESLSDHDPVIASFLDE